MGPGANWCAWARSADGRKESGSPGCKAGTFHVENRLGTIGQLGTEPAFSPDIASKQPGKACIPGLAGPPAARLWKFWALVFPSNRPETRGFLHDYPPASRRSARFVPLQGFGGDRY